MNRDLVENKCFSYPVNVTLIKEDKEYDIVPEASDPVHGRHLDHKGEDVVNESVQGLICQHAPRQVGH